MDEQKSKDERKRGFPRCTFKTNLAIGFCISLPVVAILVFTSSFVPDYSIFGKITFVLIFGILAGFLGGGFSWLMWDFE